jgi:hypothetical protein
MTNTSVHFKYKLRKLRIFYLPPKALDSPDLNGPVPREHRISEQSKSFLISLGRSVYLSSSPNNLEHACHSRCWNLLLLDFGCGILFEDSRNN